MKAINFEETLKLLASNSLSGTEGLDDIQSVNTLKQRIILLETILNQIPISVYINDKDKKKQIWGNPQAENRLGVKVNEQKKQDLETYLSHFHPDDREVIIESIKTFTENKAKEYSGFYRIKKNHDGKWKWNYSKSVLLDENNCPDLVLGISLDLSDAVNTKNQIDIILKEIRKQSKNEILKLLTEREKEVLHHISKGLKAKEIAGQLQLSVHTILAHKKKISRKLSLHCLASLASFATEHNL